MKLFAPVRTAIAAAALAFGAALPASAAFYVDDTTGGPTFNRALAGFSDLSSVGTDVAYDVYAFSVAVDGLYSIRSFAEGLLAGEPWDQFLFLYAGSFDPTAPLLNGVIGNDDYELNGEDATTPWYIPIDGIASIRAAPEGRLKEGSSSWQ